MELRPILSSLRRHRIAALLIVSEITLACAVLCNAVFMIGQRVQSILWPNAMDEAGLSYLDFPTVNRNAAADMPRNLAALKDIDGVRNVALTSAIPLAQDDGNRLPFSATPESYAGEECSGYLMTDGGDQALGLRLLQGRMFSAEEYAGSHMDDSFTLSSHVVVVTDAYARRMWPGMPPLGRQLFLHRQDQTLISFMVIGIVADVLTPVAAGLDFIPDVRIAGDNAPPGDKEFFNGCFFPLSPSTDALHDYVLRSAPQDRERILREAMHVVGRLQPASVMTGTTFMAARDRRFAGARSMVHMLVAVCIVMLAVTAFGIVGLSSFWVQQRRRQIGIRRAVGATRGDILRYFQLENLLLTTAGIALGMLAAFAVNAYLMLQYQMGRMPWFYYPLGATVLWLIGQLSVLGPALRAARVPPLVATRSS